MLSKLFAAALLTTALSTSASAGHHYHYSYGPAYSYPAYSYHHVYAAPIFAPTYVAPTYVAPVYVPPVHIAPVVHQAAYVVPTPIVRHAYYPSYGYGYHGFGRRRGGVEVEVEWKRNGYEIEVEYDD